MDNSLGLFGADLDAYLENVGGTPGKNTLKGRNWRNRFYGLPDRYDPYRIDPGRLSVKVIDKILHEAAKRARKAGKP